MVPRNVCREASPPRVEAPEVEPLTKDQVKRFLAAAATDRYHALYVLALTTGMRLGELGGLVWGSVDTDAHVVRVNRALVTGYGEQTFESPKTSGSRRTITLTSKAIQALRDHRERQQADGLPVDGNALVFTNTVGVPINPSHLMRRSFKPLLRPFHVLRT